MIRSTIKLTVLVRSLYLDKTCYTPEIVTIFQKLGNFRVNEILEYVSDGAMKKPNSSDSRVMFGVAESMGKQFLETSWAKAVPGLERSMLALRPYFAVDNGYVKSKMGRVLFPFVYKDWARQVRA